LSLSRGEVGPDGPLLLHDRAGSRRAVEIDPEVLVASAALSPDGLHVLIGTYDGRLLWTEVASGQTGILVELPKPLTIKPAALSPDGRTAAAAAEDGRVFVFDLGSETAPRVYAGPPGSITELSFSSDSRRFFSVTSTGWVGIRELFEGKRKLEFSAYCGTKVTAAAFLADGEKVITAGSDDTVRIWGVADRREEWTGQFEPGATSTLAMSTDGRTAAWAGSCRKIFIWDLERRRKKFEIATPSFFVRHLKFSPDGKLLVVAEIEGLIRFYDVGTGIEMSKLDLSTGL
jgi:WD40 repeat protein